MALSTTTTTTSHSKPTTCDYCGTSTEVGIPSSSNIAPLCRLCMLEGLRWVDFKTFKLLTEYIALWGFSTHGQSSITPYWSDG